MDAPDRMQHYERRLPHWDVVGRPLFVTFRLYGSLPASRVFPPERLNSVRGDGSGSGPVNRRPAVSAAAGNRRYGGGGFVGWGASVSAISTAFFRHHAESCSPSGDTPGGGHAMVGTIEGIHELSGQSDSGPARRSL